MLEELLESLQASAPLLEQGKRVPTVVVKSLLDGLAREMNLDFAEAIFVSRPLQQRDEAPLHGVTWFSTRTAEARVSAEKRAVLIGTETVSLSEPVRVLSAFRPGPGSYGEEPIPDSRVLAFIRFVDSQQLLQCCLVVIGDQSLAQAHVRQSLHDSLAPTLNALARALSLCAAEESYNLRLAFFDQLLSTAGSEASPTLTVLADAWREVMCCDWVWLLIYNCSTKQWEFLGTDSAAAATRCPAQISRTADHGLCEYTLACEKPQLALDPSSWRGTRDDKTYTIACTDELVRLGCARVDCIPLQQKLSSSTKRFCAHASPLRACIWAHYREQTHPVCHPEHTLLLMGRVTAEVLLSLLERERYSALEGLTRSATEVIATNSYRPLQAWQEYSKRIVQLVSKSLNTPYVSLFYRNWDDTYVACADSTGLYTRDGQPLDHKLITEKTYVRGEGLTGAVYHTGVPYVHTIGTPFGPHESKMSDTPFGLKEDEIALAIYPISLRQSQGADRVCGVVRCALASPRHGPSVAMGKNFDAFQLDLLSFICGQIAAPFETLLSYRERERVVSTTKHDLIAPLLGMRDLVDRITPSFARDSDRDQQLAEAMGRAVGQLRVALDAVERSCPAGLRESVQALAQKALTSADRFLALGAKFAPQSSQLLLEVMLATGELRTRLGEFGAPAACLRVMRADLFGAERTIKNVAQKFASKAFGLSQDLCFITTNDLDDVRDHVSLARNMVTRLDLALTDRRDFRPMLTKLGGEIIARLRNSLAKWARESHRVELRFDLETFRRSVPELHVDRDSVERALTNLLTNAVKYSYPETVVEIAGRAGPDFYYVEVINDGIGIAESEKDAVFKEGYRSPHAAKLAPGGGFGLGIAKDAMLRHGGDVVIVSGQGPTVVALKFPRHLRHRPPAGPKGV